MHPSYLLAVCLTAIVESVTHNSSERSLFLSQRQALVSEHGPSNKETPQKALSEAQEDLIFGSSELLERVQLAYEAAKKDLSPEAEPISVCTMVRNEAPYLEEWVAFLRSQGVDAFYLLNDGSTDDTADVIRRGKDVGMTLLGTDVITGVDYEPVSVQARREGTAQQVAFLNACIRNAELDQGRPTWVINIDIDEFLLPSDENGPTLAQIFQEKSKEKIHYLYMQRLLVGSSGLVFNDGRPVTERFQTRMSPEDLAEVCKYVPIGGERWRLCANYKDNTYGKFAVMSNALEGVHTAHEATLHSGSTSEECGLGQSCGLVVYHYQLKSLMEFMQRGSGSTWKAKYGSSPAAWFEIFDRAGNQVFDDAPARLLGPWKTVTPQLPSTQLQDPDGSRSIYGDDFMLRLLSGANGAGEVEDLPVGVLLMGAHHSGVSAAGRLLLSLGLWGGEPSDFESTGVEPFRSWRRKDVILMDQALADWQQGDGQSAPWTCMDFSLVNAHKVQVAEWGSKAVSVMASLVSPKVPFIVADPRISLMMPLWTDLMRGHAQPVCAILWQDLEDMGDEIERDQICTGRLDDQGVCLNIVPKGDMVDLGGRYVMESIRSCVGIPTVIMQHKRLNDAFSFLSDAHARIRTAVPRIELSSPVTSVELIAGLNDILIEAESESVLAGSEFQEPPQSITWRSLQAVAINHVMRRMTSKQEGSWAYAAASDQAAAIRDEIDTKMEAFQSFTSMGKMRRDPFGRREGDPSDVPPVWESSRLSQYMGDVWLSWTSSVSSFGLLQRVVLESLFRHNPHVKVHIYSDALEEHDQKGTLPGHCRVIQQLRNLGYSIETASFSSLDLSRHLEGMSDSESVSSSQLAGLFPYDVLYNYGGIYMDFDVVVTNPFFDLPSGNFFHYEYDGDSPPAAGSVAAESYQSQDPSTWLMSSAFMGFEKGHPFMGHLLEVAKDYSEESTDDDQLGIHMVRAELANYDGEPYVVLPMVAVAPMTWDQVSSCSNPEDEVCNERCGRNFEGGWTFRTFAGMLEVGDESSFDAKSCLGRLLSEHGITYPDD